MSDDPEPAGGKAEAARQIPSPFEGDTGPAQNWEDWSDLPIQGPERNRGPLFLERDIYRRRRIMDAARLLPVLGAALLLMPMLWARSHGTASGVVYLFVVWFGLILAAAILERRLSEPLREVGGDDPQGDGSGPTRKT